MRISLQKRLVRATSFLVLASAMSLAAAQEVPISCATYALTAAVKGTDGRTNVQVAVGDTFSFTMAPVTATSASWRIVNDNTGSPASTLVSGGTLPGTLTYTVTANSTINIGYYLDTLNPVDGTASIAASCRSGGATAQNAKAVPSLSEWGLLLTSAALALGTFVALRRRKASDSRA